jgi:AcrR family transcriptional regulator
MTATVTRERILAASLACVERWGLAKTSLEEVAQQAGLSRATVYRYFPDGREQLISETIAWEVGNYLDRLAEVTAPEPDLEAKLVRGLVFGHRAIDEHALLQRLLSTEAELFLPDLQSVMSVMEELVRRGIRVALEAAPVRPGLDLDQAAAYITGLLLSYLGSPGQWDLGDEQAVRRLVQSQFLAGVLVPATDVTSPDPWQ